MIVLKFGGTSVSTKDRIQTICDLVRREHDRQPIVVVSAIRGVTDLLLSCINTVTQVKRKKILKEIEQVHLNLIRSYWKGSNLSDIQVYLTKCLREIERILGRKGESKAIADSVVSYGEILSSYIVSKALEGAGIPAEQVLATEFIITDDSFGSAEFLPKETRRKTKTVLGPILKEGIVPVVTGFIGATKHGRTTTLGRGGSDYSAAIMGYALDADEIQIWTDVNGIYTTDPRFVTTAQLLSSVTYREASELAAFGAKVLHPRTVRPAIQAKIPVRVLNTLFPEGSGTVIENVKVGPRIAAVASKKQITLVTIYSTQMLHQKGFLAQVFSIFAKHGISVDLVSVSEVSVSVTLDNDEYLDAVVGELSVFASVTTSRAYGIVSLVGEKIVRVPHMMKHIFGILDYEGIPVAMVSMGASDINVSLVVDSSFVMKAVQALHDYLIVEQSLNWRYV